MNTLDYGKMVRDALFSVAPDIEGEEIDEELNLQDQFDLDSIDILNYVNSLNEKYKLEIPNEDFQKFLTYKGAVEYLEKSS